MPHYIVLGNFSEEMKKDIKALKNTRDAANAAIKAAGAKITRYYPLGQYDVIVVMEAPSDEVMMKLSLQINMTGRIRTQTLRAFSEEEFFKLVESTEPIGTPAR